MDNSRNNTIALQGSTQNGSAWLASALSPLRNGPRPSGYPDRLGSASVFVEVTKTTSINSSGTTTPGPLQVGTQGLAFFYLCPYSTATTNATDSNIFFLGAPVGAVTNQEQFAAPTLVNLGGTAFPESSASAYNNSTGGLCFQNTYSTITANSSSVLPVFNSILNHGITTPHRVIAAGFEVANTTAPLYQSGSVTVFDNPSNWSEGYAHVVPSGTTVTGTGSGAGGVFAPYAFKLLNGPPSDLASAILAPTSKQWPAKFGTYNVMKFCTDDNQVCAVAQPGIGQTNVGTGPPSFPFSTNGDNLMVAMQATTPDTGAPGGYTITNQQLFVANTSPNAYCYPMNGTGAYYTGLDGSNTSFQVTVRWLVEMFPTPFYNPTIMPMAKPSPMLDLLALSLYATYSRRLPPAVPAGKDPIEMIQKALRERSSVFTKRGMLTNNGK
jgi:hypothetical protein